MGSRPGSRKKIHDTGGADTILRKYGAGDTGVCAGQLRGTAVTSDFGGCAVHRSTGRRRLKRSRYRVERYDGPNQLSYRHDGQRISAGHWTITDQRLLSQSIFCAKNIAPATAGANAVTVNFTTAAAYPDIRILEYSGIDPLNPSTLRSAQQAIALPPIAEPSLPPTPLTS